MATIYTRAGDDGTTGLLGPGRFGKDDPRIDAYGNVDELNATIGVARAAPGVGPEIDRMLADIQQDLFAVGAALADPDPDGRFHGSINPAMAARLEREIDAMEADLPPLEHFILPGGTATASHLQLARTVCRRAERAVVALGQIEGQDVPMPIVAYLNRLSDLLFVAARRANLQGGMADVPWRGL